jgi:hypothetical protein
MEGMVSYSLIDLPTELLVVHVSEYLQASRYRCKRARAPGDLHRLANTCRAMRALLRPFYTPHMVTRRSRLPPQLLPRGAYCPLVDDTASAAPPQAFCSRTPTTNAHGVCCRFYSDAPRRFEGPTVWHRYLSAALLGVTLCARHAIGLALAFRMGWRPIDLGWLADTCVVLAGSYVMAKTIQAASEAAALCQRCGTPLDRHMSFCESLVEIVPPPPRGVVRATAAAALGRFFAAVRPWWRAFRPGRLLRRAWRPARRRGGGEAARRPHHHHHHTHAAAAAAAAACEHQHTDKSHHL